jgi:hypothetical protein
MKKKALLLTLMALLVAPVLRADTWTGWVTDEHCGAKGAKSTHKECALSCAKRGTALVFYNTADEKIYKLDKQDLAKEHIGAEVVVTGEVDGDSIKVTSIVDKTE